jgi:hypothetical protein
MNSKIKYLALALIIIIATVGVSVGAQYVMNSNIINVPVGAQATLALVINGTTTFNAVQYDNVVLTATCSDGSYTGTVTFLDGATAIGTATAAAGIATLTYNVSAVKTYQFKATGIHA